MSLWWQEGCAITITTENVIITDICICIHQQLALVAYTAGILCIALGQVRIACTIAWNRVSNYELYLYVSVCICKYMHNCMCVCVCTLMLLANAGTSLYLLLLCHGSKRVGVWLVVVLINVAYTTCWPANAWTKLYVWVYKCTNNWMPCRVLDSKIC